VSVRHGDRAGIRPASEIAHRPADHRRRPGGGGGFGRCDACGPCASSALPDLVFTLGSAGSRRLEHAEIYQVASVAYRDMDCSPLGFERGLTPFLEEPAVIAIPHAIPGIPAATLSSGANIVSGIAYDGIDTDMVDMETYSVLRAARRFRLPMIGLRGISDGRGELTGIHDWTEYLHIIDEKLATALDAFGEHADAGRFRLDAAGASR
jgi:adenosylhomocysteine nucleosidase